MHDYKREDASQTAFLPEPERSARVAEKNQIVQFSLRFSVAVAERLTDSDAEDVEDVEVPE